MLNSQNNSNKWSVAGIYTLPQNKKYILWTLKLMKDMPHIFSGSFDWSNSIKSIKNISKYDIIIIDNENELHNEMKNMNPLALII
jgi:hypothetical protein